MFKKIIAALGKKSLSLGLGIVLFGAWIITTGAFLLRDYSYQKCLKAIRYEHGHEAYRRFLENYKRGIGLAVLKLTDEEKAQRAKTLQSLAKTLGVSEDEIDVKKSKALIWNDRLQYYYWDYPTKNGQEVLPRVSF